VFKNRTLKKILKTARGGEEGSGKFAMRNFVPQSRALLENPIIAQLFRKWVAFCGS
jgi:hypothetical protein